MSNFIPVLPVLVHATVLISMIQVRRQPYINQSPMNPRHIGLLIKMEDRQRSEHIVNNCVLDTVCVDTSAGILTYKSHHLLHPPYILYFSITNTYFMF